MWSPLGCLQEVLREGGYIDLGIPANATVADSRNHRRRQYRVHILNRVEVEIDRYKASLFQEKDVSLWKNEKEKYKEKFSTRGTWLNIREDAPICDWYQAVWFKHATPKFSFITWIAMHGRLSTGDRMRKWNENVDASCVLCQEPLETLHHLFFDCPYTCERCNGRSIHSGMGQDSEINDERIRLEYSQDLHYQIHLSINCPHCLV